MFELVGKIRTIRYCELPPEGFDPDDWQPPSWHQTTQGLSAQKRKRSWASILVKQKMFVDGKQLKAPDHFNTEGILPDDKHFYAIKAGKVRAYGWFSTRMKGVFFVSHFVLKDGEKLAPQDTTHVIRNWRSIEKIEE